MPQKISVELLVIDDSFNEYCFHRNEADILRWEAYIRSNPKDKEIIEEARQLVLGLTAMLRAEDYDDTIQKKSTPAKIIALSSGKKEGRKKNFLVAVSAVAAMAILLVGLRYFLFPSISETRAPELAIHRNTTQAATYTAGRGEKKMLLLPDSTKLYLNAGSSVSIDNDFGKSNRAVYLTGEAMFDVTHNESIPFVVHMDKYNVKVLGTLFNVRAYPEDKLSETSLIRGKVEIQMTGSDRKIILLPNQKVVISNKGEIRDEQAKKEKDVLMLPLTPSESGHSVVETAWSRNRLEIINESLADMKNTLERWYNVKINIKDSEVNNYTFSATFEMETIETVMEVLKQAYPFNYKMEGNEITISK